MCYHQFIFVSRQIPRQTLHTWKKRRVDDHSTNNDPDSPGSEDNTVNENESMTRGPLASHVQRFRNLKSNAKITQVRSLIPQVMSQISTF